MRIFFASDSTPNAAFKSNLWRYNLYFPLVDLGHDVIEFNYDFRDVFLNLNPADLAQAAFIKKSRPKLTKELMRQLILAHNTKPIDLFFSYFYDACIIPTAIDNIRHMGITTINWYCNGSYQLHLVSEISPHYDWCLVPEKFRLQDYIDIGAKPIYCQEAANPNIYKPYNLAYEYDVTFVGQAYGDRPQYIKSILDNDIDIRVWGQGWRNYSLQNQLKKKLTSFPRSLLKSARKLFTPKGLVSLLEKLTIYADLKKNVSKEHYLVSLPSNILGGVLSDLKLIQMYSRSKINLGFSTCGDTHRIDQRIVQIRLRDFEIPMSGGFYMVEYIEELEEFFDIDKEIVCYTTLEDLLDKIRYYLKNDSKRELIRRKGYERCLRDHTWHKRLTTVFKQIDLEEI